MLVVQIETDASGSHQDSGFADESEGSAPIASEAATPAQHHVQLPLLAVLSEPLLAGLSEPTTGHDGWAPSVSELDDEQDDWADVQRTASAPEAASDMPRRQWSDPLQSPAFAASHAPPLADDDESITEVLLLSYCCPMIRFPCLPVCRLW